jgi:tripartite-type tricarboxylate transporter receptor subunit TctC
MRSFSPNTHESRARVTDFRQFLRGATVAMIAGLMLIAAVPAYAQPEPKTTDTWPDRVIRMIVPFPAGGAVDVVARIIANKLGPRLGQQIVIENRAGASGGIGVEAVARAAPDGYTIGIGTTSTHALAPTLNPKLPYDPVKDFAHISMIGSSPYVLAVYPGVAAKSVSELVQLARSKPHKLTYASAGVASMAHLSGALFEKLGQVKLSHIPYRSSAQSVIDLIAGRVDMQFGTIAPILSQIRDGAMRPLATTGLKRVQILPNLPTVAEAGLPGFESSLWMAMFMPAKTPGPIADRMNREINAVLAMPEVQADLVAQGLEIDPTSRAELSARVATDIEKWRDVVKSVGIRADRSQ